MGLNKTSRINLRMTEADAARLRDLAAGAAVDDSVALRALVRTATVDHARRGVAKAQRMGLRRAP
jgi:predicted DsbA family dithiol-disulfide isomerase